MLGKTILLIDKITNEIIYRGIIGRGMVNVTKEEEDEEEEKERKKEEEEDDVHRVTFFDGSFVLFNKRKKGLKTYFVLVFISLIGFVFLIFFYVRIRNNYEKQNRIVFDDERDRGKKKERKKEKI